MIFSQFGGRIVRSATKMKIKTSITTLVILPVMLIPVAAMAIYIFADEEERIRDRHELAEGNFEPTQQFRDYWYAGDAEITSYRLEQARYGEMHTGTAMLMFVSEDFSTRDLTKSDGNNGPKLPVLKVNFEKKFVTGIYPYSILMTVASPIDVDHHPLPLKVATSSQEWCGHTYTQLNFTGHRFEAEQHSYFPGEGDKAFTLGDILPEDAIWTRLRIAPDRLPVGEFQMIPATIYTRLRHKTLDPVAVNAQQLPADSAGTKLYQIDYKDGARQLKIWYEDKFPYGITRWEENYEEGFGPSARHMTTTATRMKMKKIDYWNHHTNGDRVLREELGL